MGCDIHLYVEKKEKGEWVSADKWVFEDDCLDVDYHNSFYHSRNYYLFALLADVRNNDSIVPISQPRGFPPDACQEVKDACERWDGDGHSHSYFTLKELLEFDWTQTIIATGIVSAPVYFKWCQWRRKEGEGPEEFARDVGGGQVINLANEEELKQALESLREKVIEEETPKVVMEKLKNSDDFAREREMYQKYEQRIDSDLAHTYAPVQWEIAHVKTCSDFWLQCIPRLLALSKTHEDVRIVFWFDN